MDRLRNLGTWLKEKLQAFGEYLKAHKGVKWLLIVAAIIVAIGSLESYAKHKENVALQAQIDKEAEDALNEGTDTTSGAGDGDTSVVQNFDANQKELEKKYGKPKEGYYWDSNGQLVAKGDPKKSAQDVGREYLQAVSKLDAKQIERYAYPSRILKTLNKYYTSSQEANDKDIFKVNTYKDVLKSIQILGVADSIEYANNKVAITYDLKHLDLSYRGFWEKDREQLFQDMYESVKHEGDRNKAKKYLYDYVLNYYESESPEYKTDKVTLVLQKSQVIGWVVTNDSQVDALGKFDNDDADRSPVGMILNEFESWYNDQEGTNPEWSEGSEDTNINSRNDMSGVPEDSQSTMPGDTGEDLSSPF